MYCAIRKTDQGKFPQELNEDVNVFQGIVQAAYSEVAFANRRAINRNFVIPKDKKNVIKVIKCSLNLAQMVRVLNRLIVEVRETLRDLHHEKWQGYVDS